MGSFILTPGDKPCRAEITYNSKTYRYTLPEAKAVGYTLGSTTAVGTACTSRYGEAGASKAGG